MSILVGYVPNATGLSAVREAERAALARTAEVLVVNVVGPLGYTAPTAAEDRDLDAVFAHVTAAGLRCSVRTVADARPPATVLLETARAAEATLIVLGLHQRSWLARRVLGSTARSVVLEAPCPVLIVPDVDPPGHRSLTDDRPVPPKPPSMP